MVLQSILKICLFALFATFIVCNVPPQEFVPNGPEVKDTQVDHMNSSRITFNPPLRFYGESYSYVVVNYNGAISLGGTATYESNMCQSSLPEYPVIAPFWMNAKKSGRVYYRKIQLGRASEEALLSKPLAAINEAFPAFKDTALADALVVTWHNVSSYNDTNDVLVAQASIVTTKDSKSFAVFFYHNTPHNGTAFSGFISPTDSSKRTLIGHVCDGNFDLEFNTNLNTPTLFETGQWVYRIDAATIYEPGSLCPKLPQYDYGSCNADDYNIGAQAECLCLRGTERTVLKCVSLPNSKPDWSGKPPECPEYTTTSPTESTTQGAQSQNFSLLNTFPILFIAFFVAFYLC